MKIKEGQWHMLPAGTELFGWKDGNRVKGTMKVSYMCRVHWAWNPDDDYITVKIRGETFGIHINTLNKNTVLSTTMSKEISKKMTKDSVWRLTDDYRYNEEFVPKGTEFRIKRKKTLMDNDDERCYVVDCKELQPNLNEYSRGGSTVTVMRSKFLAGKIELVTEGEEKVYWKLVDKNGNALLPKRFDNLGNVKSSVRYHCGYTEAEQEEIFESAQHEGILYGGDMKFDEWKAIKFNSEDKPIETVELEDWYLMYILKRE